MLSFTDSNYFNVPIDPCFEAFPRLQVSKDKRKILLTEGTSSVSLYDIASGRSLKNWTFSPSAPLTCPVVYDDHSDKFVSVQNHTEVRLLTLEDEETHDVRKLKFKRKISCLLAKNDEDNEGSNEIVVVYEDGHMNYLSEAIANRRSSSQAQSLIDASQLTLIKVLNTGKETSLDVACVTLSDGDLWFHILTMKNSNQETQLLFSMPIDANYSVYNISPLGTLGGVKSNGDICLIANGEERQKAGIATNVTDELIGFIFFPSTEAVIGVISVTNEGQEILSIVDMKYKTVEDVHLEREVTRNVINVTEDAIYVITSSSVVQKMYQIKEATLDSALKSRSRSDSTSNFQDDCQTLDTSGMPVPKKIKLPSQFDSLADDIDNLSTEEICDKLSSLKSKFGFVPEPVLVKCIQRVLNHDPTINEPESGNFFDLLVESPFDESKIIDSLQETNFSPESCMELVNHLMIKLSRDLKATKKKSTEKSNWKEKGKVFEKDSSIINWISLIMNANFKKIVISGSTYEDRIASLISKLDEIHKYCLASLEIKNTLESLMKKNGLFDSSSSIQAIPEYSIDTIFV